MNIKTLIGLFFGRKGWLSNLESITGALLGVLAILGLQRLGYTISQDRSVEIIGGGVIIGNQLFGNLDIFRRLDKILFPPMPPEGHGE